MNSDPLQEEGAEFNWEEFMEEAGLTAAPHASFKHVELSLQSSFQPGMKLEVINKSSSDSYWVSTIVATCGQLLLLRYSGYGDDRKADFWCDIMTAELHPVGWCALNNKTLMPPEVIKEKYSDWTEFLVQDLTGSRTAPANLLDGPLRGKTTVDLLVQDCVLELQDVSDPFRFWPVRVVHNVGGRLRLRYAGLSEDDRARDTWLFYLDVRLRPLGWALENQLHLAPPTEFGSLKSAPHWQQALGAARLHGQNAPLPVQVFKDHVDLQKHDFQTGMKLEMVSPWEPFNICPVSVTKVFSEIFFQVTLDDLRVDVTPRSAVCHAHSAGLLPVQWSLKNGVSLEKPRGYQDQDFDWADYLKQSGSEAAPDACFPHSGQSRGFVKDMLLEAVNPHRPEEMCVAQITQVKGHLLWLRLEGLTKSEFIVDSTSMNIFPVGWCEANVYPLTSPLRPVYQKQKKIAVVQPEKQLALPQLVEVTPVSQPVAMDTGRSCCSQIFVNHRCFSGPFLNKGRISELPQSVGPGKCPLVLKQLLNMLINAAYKPGRVLKELQELQEQQEQSWDCQEETLKAKYKGKSYRSTIRIVRVAEHVPAFCRYVCVKLQCCPNLLSPVLIADQCPEKCSLQTKTKYTYYHMKKRKVSRAAAGEETTETQVSKPTRRRKKRKSIFVQKKRRSSTMDFTCAGSPQDSDEEEDHEDLSEGNTDVSSVEVSSSRPRRAATLRRVVSAGNATSSRSVGEGRRRSTRSLSAQNQNYDKNQTPSKRQDTQVDKDKDQLILDTNPLDWSVNQVVQFINSTDCSSLAHIFQEQDVDGQALLLLTLPTVQECMDLKLGPALKLCHHIERVKVSFYRQFAN
ncbi:scm-like with four MBT domains protein 2 isoform X1 [Solea senegalensis]|uniref:Scm-like with four MBT domains protein 2 isoform X1 n=1 Tax=Solea senegalensis TaxID=28829 RepID=A0AAV6PJ53_SOLSE|nr:scm-like with four MBT domains protein 2 isoform X2 [Solea senegalensis]KAG7467689.1 scm-like with four MBT domains protein 2 isoform X1 [Solea senegalensis]